MKKMGFPDSELKKFDAAAWFLIEQNVAQATTYMQGASKHELN